MRPRWRATRSASAASQQPSSTRTHPLLLLSRQPRTPPPHLPPPRPSTPRGVLWGWEWWEGPVGRKCCHRGQGTSSWIWGRGASGARTRLSGARDLRRRAPTTISGQLVLVTGEAVNLNNWFTENSFSFHVFSIDDLFWRNAMVTWYHYFINILCVWIYWSICWILLVAFTLSIRHS